MWPPTGRGARKRPADTRGVSTRTPAGGAGDRGYGSEQQQIVQRSHEQQTPDHRKEDHQRWLGKGEEAPARLVLSWRGLALCRVQHLAPMMAQVPLVARSTRPE